MATTSNGLDGWRGPPAGTSLLSSTQRGHLADEPVEITYRYSRKAPDAQGRDEKRASIVGQLDPVLDAATGRELCDERDQAHELHDLVTEKETEARARGEEGGEAEGGLLFAGDEVAEALGVAGEGKLVSALGPRQLAGQDEARPLRPDRLPSVIGNYLVCKRNASADGPPGGCRPGLEWLSRDAIGRGTGRRAGRRTAVRGRNPDGHREALSRSLSVASGAGRGGALVRAPRSAGAPAAGAGAACVLAAAHLQRALGTSWRDISRSKVNLALLAVGLVLATTLGVLDWHFTWSPRGFHAGVCFTLSDRFAHRPHRRQRHRQQALNSATPSRHAAGGREVWPTTPRVSWPIASRWRRFLAVVSPRVMPRSPCWGSRSGSAPWSRGLE